MTAILHNRAQRKLKTVSASRVRWMGVPRMLVALGFTKREAYQPWNHRRRSLAKCYFWSRDPNEIEAILARVREKYLEAIKKHHPDAGGSVEGATLIIAIYKRLKRMAAQRGYTV